MHIQIDSREKARAIKRILETFDQREIKYFVSKLFIGDYMNMDNPRLIIDRKQSLGEVYQNLCHAKTRFAAECTRAREIGISLIVLVEHSAQIKSIDDVPRWQNPQLKKTPYAWSGEYLANVMRKWEQKYGIQFMFCTKAQTGAKIIELLGGGQHDDGTD